jgi:luciferase family oxidoreductase group 1
LQGYLSGQSRVPGVRAIPGAGTGVPLYILGSSLFGAKLAAVLGLPYAFASHFAPEALREAVALYRNEYEPSETNERPHVIAGVNVVAADTADEAEAQRRSVVRARVARMLAGERRLSDDEIEALLHSPQGQSVASMMRYTAAGTPDAVRDYLASFAAEAEADELMVVHAGPTVEARLRSVDLVAEAWGHNGRETPASWPPR